MNLQEALDTFRQSYSPDPREGLSVNPEVRGQTLMIEVRHQDDGLTRGFDVVAEPLPSEQRSAGDLGRDMAEVVHRELAYGQLPATDEQGEYRRIVV